MGFKKTKYGGRAKPEPLELFFRGFGIPMGAGNRRTRLESEKCENRNPRNIPAGGNISPDKRCPEKQLPAGINNLATGKFPGLFTNDAGSTHARVFLY